MAESENSTSNNRGPRVQRIGLIGLIVALVACVAASLAVPDVRRWLGLGASARPTMTPVAATVPSSTPTPEPPPPTHSVLYYFPLYAGASWTYSYTEQTEVQGGDDVSIREEMGLVTESVAMATTSFSDRIYTAKIAVAGQSVLSDCGERPGVASGDEYWMVADATRLFIACSQSEAHALAAELAEGTYGEREAGTPSTLPEFVFPLEPGKLWEAFPDLPLDEEDPAYQWYVESQLDLDVPAGVFTACYSIRLFTRPDATIRWLCPGIGIVAAEYRHHGTVHNYRAELVSYEITVEQ